MTGLPETGLRIVRRLAGGHVNRRWDIHQRGQGRVPEDGPVILASNHIGWLDGPLLFVTSPRPAHALVKEEEFTAGSHGRMLRFVGQIKVTRGRTDTAALRRSREALAAGQVVAIYPEGGRGDGEFTMIKGGVAWLALVSGAPVVPVVIFGTRGPGEPVDARPAKGTRIDIVYGRPIQFPVRDWPRDRDMLADVCEQIRQHLRAHVDWSKETLDRELPGPVPMGWTNG